MPNITLAVPDEIHRAMKRHREIRWSEIAKRAIAVEVSRLAAIERITSKSKLTMKDIMELDVKIKRGMYAHMKG